MILAINALRQGQAQFNASQWQRVKAASERTGYKSVSGAGAALFIVHPFFTLKVLQHPNIYFPRIPQIAARIQELQGNAEKNFQAYLGRLEERLKTVYMPIFIFAPPDDFPALEAWVERIEAAGPVIFVRTLFGTPHPIFDDGAGGLDLSYPWDILSDILHGLNIRRVYLAGELYFILKGNPGASEFDSRFYCHANGCVAAMEDQLERSGFDPDILEEFTYPNVSIELDSVPQPIQH